VSGARASGRPQSTATRAGAAVLHLKRGEYVASWAELDDGIVNFTGSLRVRDLAGERTYEERTVSHRLAPSEWIVWESDGVPG
jgi:hypothetical protein